MTDLFKFLYAVLYILVSLAWTAVTLPLLTVLGAVYIFGRMTQRYIAAMSKGLNTILR